MGQRSLKVIENGTIWKLGCGFLFAFHSNYGRIFSHFGLQRILVHYSEWPIFWKFAVALNPNPKPNPITWLQWKQTVGIAALRNSGPVTTRVLVLVLVGWWTGKLISFCCPYLYDMSGKSPESSNKSSTTVEEVQLSRQTEEDRHLEFCIQAWFPHFVKILQCLLTKCGDRLECKTRGVAEYRCCRRV